MGRKNKRILKMVLAALVLPTLIALVFLYGWISGRMQDLKMRNEIVEYVLENFQTIESKRNTMLRNCNVGAVSF